MFSFFSSLRKHVFSLRLHNVSSLPLDPVWVPFSAVKVAEEFLYFTLTLMMGESIFTLFYIVFCFFRATKFYHLFAEDWQNERPVYQYFLGDIIHIEATVMQYFHVPLRVFVDSCVASAQPDPNSNPRYAFIENHGYRI